ncbi:hypothetical protein BO78DRAFT_401077 [Aspergillus sclerotiicarbonarius CBS 121057]|uniref:Uncharacterized protein n=1 Tax=Aspergillus sclerotiicarbonarius (strain CBS 121057 / IBT 28362) TaxID=1448318 RepID=A0A319E0C5_ASPSB|nr:hypothetical protein BO78DRAFT_401077 [Aspergillus sclerotiicarbonarius CBS 121057]
MAPDSSSLVPAKRKRSTEYEPSSPMPPALAFMCPPAPTESLPDGPDLEPAVVATPDTIEGLHGTDVESDMFSAETPDVTTAETTPGPGLSPRVSWIQLLPGLSETPCPLPELLLEPAPPFLDVPTPKLQVGITIALEGKWHQGKAYYYDFDAAYARIEFSGRFFRLTDAQGTCIKPTCVHFCPPFGNGATMDRGVVLVIVREMLQRYAQEIQSAWDKFSSDMEKWRNRRRDMEFKALKDGASYDLDTIQQVYDAEVAKANRGGFDPFFIGYAPDGSTWMHAHQHRLRLGSRNACASDLYPKRLEDARNTLNKLHAYLAKSPFAVSEPTAALEPRHQPPGLPPPPPVPVGDTISPVPFDGS